MHGGHTGDLKRGAGNKDGVDACTAAERDCTLTI